MKKILLLLIVLKAIYCQAQYSDIDLIKEYNELGKNTFKFKTGVTLPNDDPFDPNYHRSVYYHDLSTLDDLDAAGDGMPYVLESLIRMYQTTKDKAYLYEYIRQALELQYNRANYSGVPSIYSFSIHMYHDGLLCWAFSHFVYVVMQEEEYTLGYSPLHQFDFIQASNNHFGITFNSFYDFANWLRIQTEQTIDFYTYGVIVSGTPPISGFSYWIDDQKCYGETPNSSTAAALNFQAPWGAALLYLGVANPNLDYLHKAIQIALAYNGTRTQEDNCDHTLGFWVHFGTSDVDVLELNSTDNTYIWNHQGWNKIECRYYGGLEDYEDLFHGVQSLIFPRAVLDVMNSSSISGMFTQTDFIRIRNTFVKNVFSGYAAGTTCPDIHSGIDGDDIITYRTENNHDYDGLNRIAVGALGWMDFHHWDNADATSQVSSTEPSVYEIVMNNYDCRGAGTNIYGLSQMVDAQLEKDCPNLNLYNRDVVYNQDFNAKNKLIINPNVAGATSYADPVITENKFIIRSDITSNLTAGETIDLLPGFEAKTGSDVRISIVPNQCTDGHRYGMFSQPAPSQAVAPPIELPALNQNSFLLYPIPAKTNITAVIPGNKNAVVTVTDMLGNIVQENTYSNEVNTINVNDLSNGLYSISIKTEDKLYIKKFVKE